MNSKKSTILFITSPEAGQANCNLAVISALKARYGAEADIHLASYVDLRKRIPPDVRFHEIRGVSMTRGLMRRNGNDQGE
ncbi:hypothetical protein I302_103558 [Kwoniella bestiolae CBS 10118]|uniref:Uncharacterized protein n=1 Tax=Kwoniella bestiolae CBS 10118 TaxID=1296100 RepID=A0AAJ8M6K3_9TREE